MNAVLGAVLFAGVTLPAVDPIIESPFVPPYAEPETAESFAPITPVAPGQRGLPTPGEPSEGRRRWRSGLRGGPAAAPPAEDAPRTPLLDEPIPPAPTDPGAVDYALPNASPAQEGAPSQEFSGQRSAVGPSLGGAGRGYGPMSPTSPHSSYRRSRDRRSASRGYNERAFAAGQLLPDWGTVPHQTNVDRPVPVPVKPFADYTPTPTVSPYLNLFNDATGLARSENYYTLVRPFLDQRNTNRRIGTELQGLQRNARRQRGPHHGGGSLSQYYQNLGGYYPGFNRR